MSRQGKTNYVTQQQFNTLRVKGGGIGHIHTNKEVLDSITALDILTWDNAAENSHTHDNKEVLDTITQDTLTELGRVSALSHSHSNKLALDLIQYNPDTKTIVIGDSSNPVNFVAYGEVTAYGPGDGGSGGVNYLYQLMDVPDYRTSYRGKYLRAKSDGSGTEWVDVTGGVSSVISLTGDITQSQLRTALGLGSLAYLNGLSKLDVGLGNVDNTADANKSVASAGKLRAVLPSTLSGQTLSFYGGQPSIGTSAGQAYLGSSNNFNLFSFPQGLYHDASFANIQNIRIAWDTSSYWTDILTHPNGNNLWMRTVNNAVAGAWVEIYHSGNLTKSTLGLGNVENKSSATIRSEITASDIPSLDASKITTGQFADARIVSASVWNNKWDYNENTIKAVKVNNAGNADTLENHSASYFATASSLGNYLPLSGGTVTGNLQIGNYASNPKLILQDSTIGTWALQVQSGVMKLGFGNGSLSLTYGGTLSIPQAATIAGNTVYHSGNCNNTSTAWSCSNLTAAQSLTIRTSGGLPSFNLSRYTENSDAGEIIFSCGASSPVNGFKISAKYSNWASRQDLVFYTSNNETAPYAPVWSEAMRIKYDRSVTLTSSLVANGEVTSGSDARWKDNISPLSSNPIMALLPCEWDWKEGHGNGHSAGFIAQDVRKILPYAVKGNEEQGYTLNYNVFHAFEVKMLQSHETEIDRLRKKVAYLESEIQRLRN